MDGNDKALLPFGDDRLIDRIAARLSAQLDTIAINSNSDPAAFANLQIPVIPDDIAGFAGPMAGILAGMDWAANQSMPFTHILTVATDTPFFPDNLAAVLCKTVDQREDHIAVAISGGIWHPVFGLWPVAQRDELRQWLHDPQNRRVRMWIETHPHRIANFPLVATQSGDPFDPFFNINRPGDLEQARLRAEESH